MTILGARFSLIDSSHWSQIARSTGASSFRSSQILSTDAVVRTSLLTPMTNLDTAKGRTVLRNASTASVILPGPKSLCRLLCTATPESSDARATMSRPSWVCPGVP